MSDTQDVVYFRFAKNGVVTKIRGRMADGYARKGKGAIFLCAPPKEIVEQITADTQDKEEAAK
ncbi:MAG: hypothetical protein WCY01_11500 [Alkalispirochaeta sp.]